MARPLLAGLLASFLLSLPAAAASISSSDPGAGSSIERTSLKRKVPRAGRLLVRNGFGDLRLRFGGYGREVEVRAVLQQFPGEGEELVVEGVETADGVEVRVGFLAGGDGPWVASRAGGWRRRADLVVFVPEGVAVDAATAAGLIEIRGVRGDVRARTASGEVIALASPGGLDLATESGSILASFDRHDGPSESSLRSATGDLTAVFWGDASYRVEVATGGRISTDFSLAIDPPAAPAARKRGHAVVGKGGALLRLESKQGHVRLQRRPSASRARQEGSR